jgi:DEAD/DEAH box helicase domain-containing protein
MISGFVQVPGTFLNAPGLLFRQWFAYSLDIWGRTWGLSDQKAFIPTSVAKLLAMQKSGGSFPKDFVAYIEQHHQELLESFCSIFGDTLRPDTRGNLAQVVAAASPKLLAKLEDTKTQIERLQTLRKRIDERIKKLADDTRLSEDQRAHQCRELERERRQIEGELQERNGKNTYQWMVEQGLLPNYAFPEDAVTLNAFIYDIPDGSNQQQDSGKKGRTKQSGHEKHAWRRPASLALREFAPFNSFYAGSRQVHIDQVFTGTRGRSTIDSWVFCSRCKFLRTAGASQRSATLSALSE